LGKAPRKPGPAKRAATRPAYFPDADGYIDTAIYQHGDLDPGATFEGPAIVQSGEFSAVVGPRQACTVDDYRNLVIAF
jgi:N-methylhydantoinase A